MRGADIDQSGLFSYVSLERRVPSKHPLRRIRALLDEALESMHRDFERVYATGGRSSIAPERLVRALVLQVLYSIRSERLLVEQLDYNLLFRWFVGLSVDEAVWDHSSFTKNRDRLIEAGVARKLLRRVGARARREGLLSSEHFSVDGTLIEAWSAVKSMRRRDGKDDPPPPGRNPHVDFAWRAAQQRDACGPARAAGEAVSQRQRPAGQALLHRSCADGASSGSGGGRRDH
jgi:transposase